MITMQEMEKELAIYRKNFTAVRLISEADILRTIEARKHNPASRACPCRAGRMTSQGCRNCIVLRAYMEKCKKIKLEYDDPNVYQVTARYLHVEGGRYVLELVQKLDDDMMIDAESGEKLANRLSSYEDKLYHDALTGTLNRRYYEEHMCKTVYEAGIAMIDVDNFKLYNFIMMFSGIARAMLCWRRWRSPLSCIPRAAICWCAWAETSSCWLCPASPLTACTAACCK